MSKKTATLVVLLALLVVLIIVCLYLKNGQKNTEETSSSEASQTVDELTDDASLTTDENSSSPSDKPKFNITPKAISEKYVFDGDTLIFNSINCPIFDEVEGYNIEKINSYLKDYCENYVKISSSDKSVAKEDYEAAILDGFDFEPYEKASDYTFYINETTASIKFEAFEQSGGADSDNYIFALCFDLVTGERLTFGDFSGMTEDEANEYMYNAFKKLISENQENFFDDALNLLPNIIDEYSYYLTADGANLFLNSSVLSPNAFGTQKIVIPYSEISTSR